jgi:hypothetical protein
MSILNLKTAGLAIVVGIGLSGCAYSPYGGLGVGVGYGNGYYDPYYNNGRYYGGGYGYPYGSGYGYPYGSGYGYPYGYGSSYYGWNNGYYYPGTGYYVYDRNRRPHRWSDAQRRYWERQRGIATSSGGVSRVIENWADFQNGQSSATVRQRGVDRRQRIIRERPVASSPQVRQERRASRVEARQVRTQQQAEASVRQEGREARAEARQDRRGTRGRRVNKD